MSQASINFKSINKIAIPALIAGVAEPLLSITDTAIIGNIDIHAVESLAAVGIVGAFISMLIWVFGQTRSAISAIVSQYLGAGKLDEIKNLPAQSIFIIVLLSLFILGISYPFASNIFQFYNADNLILSYCIEYYQIRVFGFPFSLFTFAIFGVFRGLQNTYYPMMIAITGALLNIGLDIAFVYGIEGWIPAMNIKGAAYASVIAQIVMALIAAYLLVKKTTIPLLVSLPFHPEIKRLISMILNLFIRTLALNIALYFGTSFATAYGKEYIAAYTIGLNLWMLGAFMIDGYASAGNIVSGKLFGQKAYTSLWLLNKKLLKYAAVLGLLFIAFGTLFYNQIGLLFTKEPAVLAEFYKVFWIILLMQPLCAMTFVFDGTFKGLGEMKYLRNVLIFATGFGFIPTLLFFDWLDWKLYAIWIAFTVWIFFRGIFLYFKFNRMFLPLVQKP
jgi:multidrug resistance protein, MATE family